MISKPFHFKQFTIHQDMAAMKVGTDGVLLGAWTEHLNASQILDIGSGTGLIALMMAQKYSNAKIDAVELDRDAYNQSKSNFERSPWSGRIKAHLSDIQDFKTTNHYDIIICNPPFFLEGIRSANKSRNRARNARFLSPEKLIHSVTRLLAEKGGFFLILPAEIADQFLRSANTKELFLTKKVDVHSRTGKPIERRLLKFEKENGNLVESELTIHAENKVKREYTAEYISITQDFYLNL